MTRSYFRMAACRNTTSGAMGPSMEIPSNRNCRTAGCRCICSSSPNRPPSPQCGFSPDSATRGGLPCSFLPMRTRNPGCRDAAFCVRDLDGATKRDVRCDVCYGKSGRDERHDRCCMGVGQMREQIGVSAEVVPCGLQGGLVNWSGYQSVDSFGECFSGCISNGEICCRSCCRCAGTHDIVLFLHAAGRQEHLVFCDGVFFPLWVPAFEYPVAACDSVGSSEHVRGAEDDDVLSYFEGQLLEGLADDFRSDSGRVAGGQSNCRILRRELLRAGRAGMMFLRHFRCCNFSCVWSRFVDVSPRSRKAVV